MVTITEITGDDQMRIVLCMIVKDEQLIIGRCLRSLISLVDSAVICDTGSTDATKEIANQVLSAQFGPSGYLVFDEPWKNFGYNRTVGLKRAREFISDTLGWQKNHTFLLTVDADMVLSYEKFSKDQLDPNESSYLVQQSHGGLIYDNRRLLNSAWDWVSEGVTHEVNQAPNLPGNPQRITTLSVNDHNDGSSHNVKNVRDEDLLRQGLVDEPTNVRYMFYLANTLRESGHPEKIRESLMWYERHRTLQQWAEEKWYSRYSMGLAWESLTEQATGDDNKKVCWEKAMEHFVAAYAERPSRAEPLYHIAKYYRIHNEPCRGFIFAKTACTIPFPKEEILFVQKHLHDYAIDEELSICGFYASRKNGWKALQRMLRLRSDRPRADWGLVSQAFYNLQFYETYHTRDITDCIVRWTRITAPELTADPNYTSCNPSLVEDRHQPGRILVLLRSVNYDQFNVRRFVSREPSGTFRTKNYLLEIDPAAPDLDVRNVIPLKYNEWEGPTHSGTQVHGLEDCRIHYDAQGVLSCSATCLELTPDCRPKITRVPLCIAAPQDVYNPEPLPGQTDGSCEKNWLPITGTDQFLYGINQESSKPVRAVLIDGGVLPESCRDRSMIDLRGSSGPVSLVGLEGYTGAGAWLVLYHAVCDRSDYRHYYQKFIVWSAEWELVAQSDIFCFRKNNVEMGTGMVRMGSQLYISLGIEDREAWLVQLDLCKVLAMCT